MVGQGWFAHLGCDRDAVALAWEATTGPARAEDKKAGWALLDAQGNVLAKGSAGQGSTAAATAFLSGGLLELLWLDVDGQQPLSGSLMHQVLQWR